MPDFGSLLPPPLRARHGIPLYYDKTDNEFRADDYERFDGLVTRQAALHLHDELHGGYPFQPLLDWLLAWLPDRNNLVALDVGCSVGRLIAEIARRQPTWDCYGVDYSYQMLALARRFWVLGRPEPLRLDRFGWAGPQGQGQRMDNLSFLLAKAEALPFPDASVDLLLTTFLLDRVKNMHRLVEGFLRPCAPGALLLCVTPLNFLRADQWRDFYPPVKLLHHLENNGWEVLDWTDPFALREPLDARGNAVHWQCLRFVARKGG